MSQFFCSYSQQEVKQGGRLVVAQTAERAALLYAHGYEGVGEDFDTVVYIRDVNGIVYTVRVALTAEIIDQDE